MKEFLFVLALAALPAAASFAASGTAIPGGNQAAPFVISKPGAYYLAADRVMTDPSKNAIEVAASDVTLDLNGYTLRFSSDEGTGLAISAGTIYNLEIRNGSIAYLPSTAISVWSGENVRIIDVRIHDSATGFGITSGAANTLVERCHISLVNKYAVNLWSGTGDVIRNNQIVNCTNGIHASANARVSHNTVQQIPGNGIEVGGESLIDHNTVLYANKNRSTTGGGIVATGALSTVRDNLVEGFNGMVSAEGLCLFENNMVSVWDAGATAFINLAGSGARCTRVNNRYYVVSGTVSSGTWVDAGGNISL
ncbi:hypothetical protein DB347_05380 [Opitutaceae bacterium EW11]|nr:hypothetical protein DB347_05380 [Opitutaceae bacterium EW11]